MHNYIDHEEIPSNIASYILTVSDADNIAELSLEDINSFLNGVEDMVDYKGVDYDDRHGGPFDRGSADSYYGRVRDPHYFVGDTYNSTMKGIREMTNAEIDAYHAGYDYNESMGDKKDWG